MRIAENIRQHTMQLRDRITGLENHKIEIESIRNAAEERIKHVSTEITQQRTLENEQKRSQNKIEEKIVEAQRTLDDLERRRTEALDVLIQCQEEQKIVRHSLHSTQEATEKAIAKIRKEQKSKQDTEAELTNIRKERRIIEEAFRGLLMKALDQYIEQQITLIQTAFSTQEQRSKARKEIESLKQARHTDIEIGKLCDERDEIRKLLENVMVPGVKIILQKSLGDIEEKLARRFPGALQMPELTLNDNQIEELLFYCDKDGKAICLLPISLSDWNANDINEDRMSKVMCLIWNMIRELGLKTEDGDFKIINDHPVFASRFDLEILVRQGFSVKHNGAEVIRFVFAAVPTELQEAISHENKDN